MRNVEKQRKGTPLKNDISSLSSYSRKKRNLETVRHGKNSGGDTIGGDTKLEGRTSRQKKKTIEEGKTRILWKV